MTEQEARDLADRIMAEAPILNPKVTKLSRPEAKDLDDYVVQVLSKPDGEQTDLSSAADWEEYAARINS